MKQGDGGKRHGWGEVSFSCQMSMDHKCLQRDGHHQHFVIKKEMHKDFVFHKHLIYRVLIYNRLTVSGSAAYFGLLLNTDDKSAFSILSQKNCECVARLHPVLLPRFHVTYT